MNSPQLVSADGKPISQKMAAEWSLQKRGKQVSIVPHVQTFGSLQNWMSRTYRFSFDEAVRNNYDTAKSMPNDAFIQGLYRNRVTPVVKSDFRVISKGPGASEECNDFYKSMLLQIPYWHDFRRNVMKCAWSGRHGIQMAFDDMTAEGVPFKWNGKSARSISQWIPHLGDKITFTFDLMPCIRVSPLYMGQWKNDFGATILQPNDPRIVKEAVGYRWTEEGPVVVLDNMQVRKQFCISVFEIEDAPWDDPQLAGGIRGVGLRHYAFWNWNHMLEIQSWAMLHLEEFGVGGYTVVGYDGPEGLARAQATFEDREQHVLYVPVTPGTDERVTDMATRLEPSGTGNDAVFKWANDYFGNHLIVLFVGHPLNMQAGATGLNSDQGSHAKDILTSIHKSDAEILDNAMSYQVLTRLKEENDPEGTYTLEFESAVRAVDKDAGMTRIKAYFDMGGKVPGSLARMMADMGDKVEDGDTDYLQDQRYQQQAMQQSMMQASPPPGSEDTSYLERGAEGQDSIGSIFRAGDAGGAKPTGTTLAQARRKLEAKGIAPEDVLATLAQAVASGKLIEHDDEGGVSYSPGKGQVASYSTERNEVDPSAKWSEEPAPRAAGGRRWRNNETGEVTYRQPSAGRHVQVGGDEHTGDRLNRAQGEGVGVTPGKGVATAGIHARIMMLATEGGASLKGEGVLSEVHNVDKRLKKAEAVQLAGRLGLRVDSGTSKTAALAHIEHVLRLKQGGNANKPGESGKAEEKPGITARNGKESADPVGGDKGPSSPEVQLSPTGDNPDSASGDRPGDGASSPASPAESVSPTVSPDAPQATAGSTEEPRRPDEGVKDYLTRIGHKEVAKDVLGRAKALHKEEKYKVDAHNSVIKDAVETLSDMHGKNYRRNSPVWGKFEGDYTKIPGFDEMAKDVIAEYPGVFAPAGGQGEQAQDFGEHADNIEKLWGMLKEGKQSYPDMRASEDRALEEAEAGNYDTGAIEEDTSFEYGANVEGENDAYDNDAGTQGNGADESIATEGTSEAGASLASGTDSNAGDAEGRTEALPESPAGDTARSADAGNEPGTATEGQVDHAEEPGQAGTEAGNSLSQAAEVSTGQAEALQTAEGSGDPETATAGTRSVESGEATPDSATGEEGFMKQEQAGPHTAEDVPSYRGLSFTNSEGLTVDVKQEADGTWSVGSNTGLTQAGVANLLNKTKAEKARSLFGDEAQAQAEPAKPKEQLQWSKPTARKESGDLPGMRDAFAPGMFGQAASQAEEGQGEQAEQPAGQVSPTGNSELPEGITHGLNTGGGKATSVYMVHSPRAKRDNKMFDERDHGSKDSALEAAKSFQQEHLEDLVHVKYANKMGSEWVDQARREYNKLPEEDQDKYRGVLHYGYERQQGRVKSSPTGDNAKPGGWESGGKESAGEALSRVKESPNQPADRDWSKYAERFGVEGNFHHVEIPTDQLAKNLQSGHLRRSNSIDADSVSGKVKSGDRNPVIITKEPGKGSLVVDGNHSLQAAIDNGDKTVKAIVSEKSHLLPSENSFDDIYNPSNVPVVSNDEAEKGNWDQFHPGLASELTQRKMAAGMKGIEGREYGIREHSPGKWQMVSRKPGQGESANGMGTEHTGRNGPGPVGVHAEQQPEYVHVDNERQLQPAEQPNEGGGSSTVQAGEGSGQAKAEGENETQAIDLRDQAKAGKRIAKLKKEIEDIREKMYQRSKGRRVSGGALNRDIQQMQTVLDGKRKELKELES